MVKQDRRIAKDRSILAQNAAFSTARTPTSHAEQKTIQKERGEGGGAEDFKKRGAKLITQSAAEIAGIPRRRRRQISKHHRIQ